MLLPELPMHFADASGRIRVGIDVVMVNRITESLERFGRRFLERVFTVQEIAYAQAAPECCAERLAARFAAKEAGLKALRLANKGIRWTDIEVLRLSSGDCEMRLHGKAAATAREEGLRQVALSLSHEGDYAAAIVLASYESP